MSRVSISSDPSKRGGQWTQLYLGLGFTSLATLMLELSLTRLFSVVFFYHFAFLAISLALFGLGAGGVFSYIIAARPGNLWAELGRMTFLNSIIVVLLLWFILYQRGEMSLWTLASVYLASAIPFFFAGAVMSLAVGEAIDRIDRAYFFDLTGAAVGCLLLIPFLDLFGGPNTVIAAGVIYGVASSFWFNRAGEEKLRAAAVLVALMLVALMIVNGASHIFDVRWAKGERLPEEQFSKWNSFSRVGLSRIVTPNGGAYWDIRIDADAATGIPEIDWDKGLSEAERQQLLYRGAGLPYLLRPAAKTLIIGSGGGYDVARALASGSRDVTAVEINPIIAKDIMQGQMLRASFGLYKRPEVTVHIEDGRSFIRGSSQRYQILQATLVDTWASTAAGAFALSENNLYTSEAFYDYLSHLTEDGLLAFSRWGFDPPRESLRVVSLGMAALSRLEEADPASHVIVVREKAADIAGWGALDTILISRKPLSAADVAQARTAASAAALEILYLPGEPVSNPFGELLHAPDPESFWARYRYDVRPVSDDRPFFFYTVQPRDLWEFLRSGNSQSADYKVNRAVPLLFGLMLVSLVAMLIVMLLPRVALGSRLPKQKGLLTFLLYFVCLGAGYILIQMALIQKFMLLLGRPSYALIVIVFAMLVSSGAGSFVSRRAIADDDTRLRTLLLLIALAVAALAFAIPFLVRTAAAWALPLRMLITCVSIAPVAFLMGMPFPSGLRRLRAMHAPSVRWAWSLNAAASVLGSVASVLSAIYFGLRTTLLLGAFLYLLALLFVRARRANSASPLGA